MPAGTVALIRFGTEMLGTSAVFVVMCVLPAMLALGSAVCLLLMRAREEAIGRMYAVDLVGAWVAGQGSKGVWADGLQAVGYRDGEEVARTEWFESIGPEPAWFEIAFEDLPRIPLWQPALNVAMNGASGYEFWFHRQLDVRPLKVG
mgnify:CR=1 FL=1